MLTTGLPTPNTSCQRGDLQLVCASVDKCIPANVLRFPRYYSY